MCCCKVEGLDREGGESLAGRSADGAVVVPSAAVYCAHIHVPHYTSQDYLRADLLTNAEDMTL